MGASKVDLRLGLVGCGRLAEWGYVHALRRTRGVSLAAVADSVRSRCSLIAPNLPSYADAASMIEAGGIDAIVLATPASTHLVDAMRAAEAGLPTLIQKPPAATAAEAAALARLVPPPWVAFNRRFDPLLKRLRSNIPAAGELALSLELHYQDGSWRPYVVDDDALLSVGTHLIDLVRWLSRSDIRRVRTIALTITQAVVELDLARGTARLSCATDQPSRDRIEVRDAAGRELARFDGVRIGSKAMQAWMMLRDPDLRRLIHPASTSSLVRRLIQELEAFRSAVAGAASSPLATAADGLAVMAVVDAARRSSREHGSWQAVERFPQHEAQLEMAVG